MALTSSAHEPTHFFFARNVLCGKSVHGSSPFSQVFNQDALQERLGVFVFQFRQIMTPPAVRLTQRARANSSSVSRRNRTRSPIRTGVISPRRTSFSNIRTPIPREAAAVFLLIRMVSSLMDA